MTTPTDGVEGTQGKLFYWTRQGISLADFQHQVELAIERVNAAGGVAGITELGHDLITAETMQQARDVIDAASKAEASAGGGGGGSGTIDLPIAISDVSDLSNQLGQKSAVGHHHVAGDLNGLSSAVQALLASTDHATLVAAIALTVGELSGITDVGVSTITATGVDLAARQTASRLALDAAKSVHGHVVTDTATLSTTLTSLDTRLDVLEAGNTTLPQELLWNGNATTTNATSYGVYDATRAIHYFRGSRDPLIAGYTLAIGDEWFQPETEPPIIDPDPPTTITLSITDQTTTGFRLNWTAIPNSTGYRVTRDAGGGEPAPWTGIDPPTARYRDVIFLVANSTYVVTVEAMPSGITASKSVTLGAAVPPTEPPVPGPTLPNNKYGFMVFLGAGSSGLDKDIAAIKESGGTWARIGMYNSGSFNTSGVFLPNATIWNEFKYACQTAKAAGLQVIWDAADTLRLAPTLSDATWIVWQKSMWLYMAQTLGPWVDAWQIFNEHDVRHIRDFSPVGTLTSTYMNFFRDALQGARNSIRQAGNNGPVGTTVFGYPMDEARYTRWTQFHDVVSVQMDYIGIHAYPEFNGTIFTDFVTRLYTRYNKPIAPLEFGLPDASGYGVAPQYLRVGDGIVIQNNALLAVKAKLLCATLYDLRNRGLGGTGELGFGIYDNNWTKKAYQPTVAASIARWN